MSQHNQPAIAGPRKPILFFSVTTGKFAFKYPWARRNPEYENTYQIEGTFQSTNVVWDPGKGEIKPHWRGIVTLASFVNDPKNETLEADFIVQISHPTTAMRMMASYLPNIKVGDRIQINTGGGSDNSKVSTIHMKRYEVSGEDGEQVLEKVERVEFPAKPTLDPNTPDGHEALELWDKERNDLAFKIFKSHDAYVGDKKCDKPELKAREEDPPADMAPLEQKFEVLGMSMTMPPEEDFNVSVSPGDKAFSAIREFVSQRLGLTELGDLGLALYTIQVEIATAVDKQLDDLDHILTGGFDKFSRGDIKLLARLLGFGPEKAVKNAIQTRRKEYNELLKQIPERAAVAGATQAMSADEYDPFADE